MGIPDIRLLLRLEYLLDKNKKKGKGDQVIKDLYEAWGIARELKERENKRTASYNPPLPVIFDSIGRKKVNPTWTGRRRKYHEIIKANQRGGQK